MSMRVAFLICSLWRLPSLDTLGADHPGIPLWPVGGVPDEPEGAAVMGLLDRDGSARVP